MTDVLIACVMCLSAFAIVLGYLAYMEWRDIQNQYRFQELEDDDDLTR